MYMCTKVNIDEDSTVFLRGSFKNFFFWTPPNRVNLGPMRCQSWGVRPTRGLFMSNLVQCTIHDIALQHIFQQTAAVCVRGAAIPAMDASNRARRLPTRSSRPAPIP